ncbi:site-specific DNA-methyltransferase [Kocuria rhizophila]|uniref:site-specific DNA-methyltransferase n=1 Tax=Kocuria rhizophila TaxID=72000 RepID=UPI002E136FB5|nr:site-specific DNA-methyltransferase [Kocuria rhizophila]
MIRDAHEANATATPADFELARLRAALPEYFGKNGDFMLDRLQETLSSADVSMTREGYELKFLGKSYAKYLTSTRTETVVVPDIEHNAEAVNADSENLYIVGDNLDALKHLLGSYAGKVKCIYIDPPYNTGSDGFVYVDDFGFTAKDLVEKVGLDEGEAGRVMSLQGKSSHSAWLTFMYPRLELAKELLADDGVIFISIDDNEQANLKVLCDEVFGEANFVENYVWESNFRPDNSSRIERENAQHVLSYARNKSAINSLVGAQKSTEGLPSLTKSSMNPSTLEFRPDWVDLQLADGLYRAGERKSGYVLETDLVVENGRAQAAFKLTGRVIWGQRYLEEQVANGTRIVIKGDGFVPYSRKLETAALAPTTLIPRESVGDVLAANAEVRSLFGEQVFSHPKPTTLVSYLLNTIISSDKDAVVVDFFSGSGTTAHSVISMNSKDSGSRKFIAVQWAEAVAPGSVAEACGYATIDEVGRERIRLAAQAARSASGADIDYGFRVFRLEEPSEKTLDQLQSFDPNEDGALLAGDFVSKFASNGTPGDQVALSTWLVQDGFGLTPEVNDVGLDDYKLKVCEDSGYVIQPGLDSDDVMALVAKLEAGELDLKRLVVFGYSVPFSVMHELRQNLKSLRSGQSVSVIERY